MLCRPLVSVALVVLGIFLIAIPAEPVLAQRTVAIPVVNPSFEDNEISSHFMHARRGLKAGSVTGWAIESSHAGVLDIGNRFKDKFAADATEAHGKAAAFIGRSGTIMQRLEENVEPGMRYTLSVAVGQRSDLAPAGYIIELLGGDSVIASSSEPIPNPGSFIRSVATVEIDDAHPAIGQPLSIRLLKTAGRQVSFDGVRLTKTLPLTLAQRIERSVDARVMAWAKKGKFEKSEDHARRVTDATKAAARDSIQQVVINEIAAGEIDWTTAQNRYDADREVFTIAVKDLEPFNVPVPIAEAEAFDADFRSLAYENAAFAMDGDALRLTAVDIVHTASGTTYPVRLDD